MVNTITEKQTALLTRLTAERDIDNNDLRLEELRHRYREGIATVQDASAVISWLLSSPKKHADIEAGIYQSESGALYRVYLGQNSGRMLCKQVVLDALGDFSYEYVGRADLYMPTARRLTRQEVAEYTLSYGITHCLVCGRRLDDPESVDRGIGPVCWENYA